MLRQKLSSFFGGCALLLRQPTHRGMALLRAGEQKHQDIVRAATAIAPVTGAFRTRASVFPDAIEGRDLLRHLSGPIPRRSGGKGGGCLPCCPGDCPFMPRPIVGVVASPLLERLPLLSGLLGSGGGCLTISPFGEHDEGMPPVAAFRIVAGISTGLGGALLVSGLLTHGSCPWLTGARCELPSRVSQACSARHDSVPSPR